MVYRRTRNGHEKVTAHTDLLTAPPFAGADPDGVRRPFRVTGRQDVTRHRSPKGRDAGQDRQDQRHRTAPFVVPAGARRGGARHRPSARAALRPGVLAAGITGGALALVAPAALQLPAEDTQANLALSSEGAALADEGSSARTGGSGGSTGGAVSSASGSAASADLIKATDRDRRADAETAAAAVEGQAEQARAATARAEEEQQAAVTTDCGASGSYGGVADSVQTVGNAMECVFPGRDVLGIGSRGGQSDHPDGYALDFMTTEGDSIADCVVDNSDALGVSYVIWNQRINSGSGWESMEDRGGATANHEDHVHISFDRGGSPDVSALGNCG